MAESKWLLQGEAAKFLGISSSSIYLWIQKGILEPHSRPGRYEKFFNVNDLKKIRAKREAAIAKNKRGTKPSKKTTKKPSLPTKQREDLENIIEQFALINGKLWEAVKNHDKAIDKLNGTSKLIIDLINNINTYIRKTNENTHKTDNG